MNSQHNNDTCNNTVFINDYAKIVVRFEDIVHSLWVVHYVLNPDHYFGIVIAKHNVIIIVVAYMNMDDMAYLVILSTADDMPII